MTVIAFIYSLIGCFSLLGNEPSILASWDSKKVQLTIKIPSPAGISKCFIERSSNGKHYFVLNQLAEMPSGLDSVFYADYNPLYINYYRLKIRKAGGATVYSDVVMVKNDAALEASIFFNSLHKTLEVQLKNGLKATCHIYDMDGKKLKSFSLRRDNNSINLSDYPIGNYFVQVITNKDQSFGKKLLIQ